jgi:hypothetical protein
LATHQHQRAGLEDGGDDGAAVTAFDRANAEHFHEDAVGCHQGTFGGTHPVFAGVDRTDIAWV